MGNIDYKSLAAKLFCYAVFGVLAVLLFKYLLGLLVPFLISWGIAYLVYPTACELSARVKIPRKICSFVLLFLLLAIILLLVLLIGNRLVYEIQNLTEYLNNNSDTIAKYFENAFEFIGSVGEKLPIISNIQNTELVESISKNINALIEKMWSSALEGLGSAIPRLAANFVMTLPGIFLVSLVSVVACFYFALDMELLHQKLKLLLPERVKMILLNIKSRASSGFKKYIRAYLILFGITFAELILGFWILGVDYAFVLALLISFVDFLPLFGTAAVLLPWGVILILVKDYFLGIGVLILCAVTTVVRQVLEPKVLGKSLGVHPILTLITLYIGFELFGFLGMILLPILTVIFISDPQKQKK